MTLGVVAHSLRAVSAQDVAGLHQGAVDRGLPFHVHIEEQPKEVAECVKVHGKTPMRLFLDTVKERNLSSTTAVHCNHTSQEDLDDFLARALTEANLALVVVVLVRVGDIVGPG